MLWVAIGQAPSMFLYAYLGTMAQHGLRLWQGKSNPTTLEYVVWIGGLLLTLAATITLARIALRAEAGAVLARGSAQVPVTQLFVTGGDTSVRGYGFFAWWRIIVGSVALVALLLGA